MAKMGQPILPMMGGATPAEPEEGEESEGEEGSIVSIHIWCIVYSEVD